MEADSTVLSAAETDGLGALDLRHPPGTFAPTPATRVTIRAVARHRDRLAGVGVDWGCGIGVLSIAAARAGAVELVVGLDIDASNVAVAEDNARRNGVADRVRFALADSFEPLAEEGRALLTPLWGSLDFILANPPASDTNDGFDFRRRVLGEGAELLRPGGLVLVQALSAYGAPRVEALAGDAYAYEGVALRTELVPLDLDLDPLRRQHATYVREERGGGLPYEFFVGDDEAPVTAVEALGPLKAGETIRGRWQVHRFRKLA